MSHSTIEFLPVPEDLAHQVRQTFRVPVSEKESISAVISSIAYPVSDIGLGGIGILVEDNQTFEIGDPLDGCRLNFKDTRLTDLTGKIVHCAFHDNGLWQFGIQWIDLADSQKKILEQELSRLKKQVLTPPEEKK
jgi:c-di-GMP-binding flagellar brake protein YcgR